MEKESIDYHAAEAILNSNRNALFRRGTRFDRNFFDWCRTADFGIAEIMTLFPKARGKGRIRYSCEVQCPQCKSWRVEEYGREKLGQLISFVKSGAESSCGRRFCCTACVEADVEATKPTSAPRHVDNQLLKLAQKEAEKARQRTPAFIAIFLDPTRGWNPEVSDANRFLRMTHERIDGAMLYEAILQMPSEVFAKTPYWIAVRGEALRRAGGRCSLCGAASDLSVHLRKSGWQGNLHTEEGLREILFLCERCKNTHTLISNSPS